jgi:hypothetical protein
MNSMIKKAAVAGGVAAAALAIGVGPASAAGNVTVAGGPNYTAASKGGPLVLSSGVTMNCTTGGATGTVIPGVHPTADKVGEITSTTWNSCTALGFSSTVSQSGTWEIWATGPTVGGVTPGEIRNVDATITIGGGLCTLHVTGTAPGEFRNPTSTKGSQLVLTGSPAGTLNVAKSGLCVGVGSSGTFTGEYDVTGSPTNPITVS